MFQAPKAFVTSAAIAHQPVLEDSTCNPRPKRSNWFLRHWRGETSLGRAFWLNAVFLANVLPNLFVIAYVVTNR
jgi:hypothetical protein